MVGGFPSLEPAPGLAGNTQGDQTGRKNLSAIPILLPLAEPSSPCSPTGVGKKQLWSSSTPGAAGIVAAVGGRGQLLLNMEGKGGRGFLPDSDLGT